MTQTTKLALIASLKKLLSQKPFNKITINDLTEDCGINRMTFYYHFKDIYDLLEFAFQQECEKLINNNKTITTWQIGLLNVFNGLIENKEFILNVYHHVEKQQVENYLYTVITPLLTDIVESYIKDNKLNVKEKDKKFIINFYLFAFVGYILDWVNHNMADDPQDIINHIAVITKGTTEKALTYYNTNLY